MPDQNDQNELVTSFLADRDAVCPVCTYNLRSARSDRCPECGWKLKLTIAHPSGQPRGWWLSAMLGLALSGVMLVMMLLPLLEAVATNVNDPRLSAMVSAGVVPSSALPNWASVLRMTALVMIVLTAMAWLWAMRARFAACRTWLRVVLSLLGILSPFITLGLAYLLTT